jgi:hypothetical protein
MRAGRNRCLTKQFFYCPAGKRTPAAASKANLRGIRNMRTQGGNEGEAPLRKIAVLAAQSFPQPQRKKAMKPCLKPFLTVFAIIL